MTLRKQIYLRFLDSKIHDLRVGLHLLVVSFRTRFTYESKNGSYILCHEKRSPCHA